MSTLATKDPTPKPVLIESRLHYLGASTPFVRLFLLSSPPSYHSGSVASCGVVGDGLVPSEGQVGGRWG